MAHFLNPGGGLYLAEGHPCAHVFDDEKRMPDGMPGYCTPYFVRQPLRFDDPRDYADDSARLENATTYEWLHPLGEGDARFGDSDRGNSDGFGSANKRRGARRGYHRGRDWHQPRALIHFHL